MLPVATNLRNVRIPWVTYAIAAGDTVIHLLVTWNTNFTISDSIASTFGFVPASISNLNISAIPTLVTSMFLHGDLLHLVGNMVFLLVFGRQVEIQFEKLNFLAFYLTAGITACLAHTLMEPDSTTPLIGASGAISGVLGAFFVCNPRARITLVLEPILIYFLCRLWVRVPAWIFLPAWFFLQLSMALKPHGSNVAFWAHVGGFVGGMIMAIAVYNYMPRKNCSPRQPI
ncbi:MAG TPA: rhomboid family intramembrane serine protease [Candidatus Acidoferrales bacterium]|nr:rhomboid family intramembrane serine protease [Candidatus Acidoferrales bacterium]